MSEAKFDLTRLRSTDDEDEPDRAWSPGRNPSDDRLIAFAQVRDLTPFRGRAQQPSRLPDGGAHHRHLSGIPDRQTRGVRPPGTAPTVWPCTCGRRSHDRRRTAGIADRVLPRPWAPVWGDLIIGRRPTSRVNWSDCHPSELRRGR